MRANVCHTFAGIQCTSIKNSCGRRHNSEVNAQWNTMQVCELGRAYAWRHWLDARTGRFVTDGITAKIPAQPMNRMRPVHCMPGLRNKLVVKAPIPGRNSRCPCTKHTDQTHPLNFDDADDDDDDDDRIVPLFSL